VNFAGTGSNARSRIGILAGLLLVLERILPMVMYTGQALISPEKLVKSIWSDNPIIGTTVDPGGKLFTQEQNGLLALETPLQELVRTYLIPAYPTTCPPYASLKIIASHLNHILKLVYKPYLRYTRPDRSVADTVNNISIIECCCMSTIVMTGFRPHQVLTKWVQYVKMVLLYICEPE